MKLAVGGLWLCIYMVLIIAVVGLLYVFGGITLLSRFYSLNGIKAKTMGGGNTKLRGG